MTRQPMQPDFSPRSLEASNKARRAMREDIERINDRIDALARRQLKVLDALFKLADALAYGAEGNLQAAAFDIENLSARFQEAEV